MQETTLKQLQWWALYTIPLVVLWLFEGIYSVIQGNMELLWDIEARLMRTILMGLPIMVLILFTESRLKKNQYHDVRRGLLWATTTVIGMMILLAGVYVAQAGWSILGGGSVGGAMWLAMIFFPAPIYMPIIMLIAYALGQYLPRDGS